MQSYVLVGTHRYGCCYRERYGPYVGRSDRLPKRSLGVVDGPAYPTTWRNFPSTSHSTGIHQASFLAPSHVSPDRAFTPFITWPKWMKKCILRRRGMTDFRCDWKFVARSRLEGKMRKSNIFIQSSLTVVISVVPVRLASAEASIVHGLIVPP